MNFRVTHKKKIAWCIVDNLALCQSGWAKEIAINLTDYMIYKTSAHDYDIYIGQDEDELLREVSKETYSHAVMVASGTSFKLSDRIFGTVEKLCENEFVVAGHILDREESYYKNAYYELHHQFYVVNLNEYKDLGLPTIGKEIAGSYTQIKPYRSEGCLHGDHQVPEWVTTGTDLKTYSYRCHGWNIISIALSNNKKIIDLGVDVRDSKKYVYYEHDHVFLKEVTSIYYNQFFCISFITAWNSDRITDVIPFTGPVDQYITVGTGYNWIKNLETVGFTDSTKVVFTDNNIACLKFMKAMVTEWDGIDYASFYASKMDILPNNTFFDMNSYVQSTADQWDKFVNSFADWDSTWDKIKKLTYDFVHIDYMTSYNLDWIDSNKNTLINLSDLFNHVPYVATQSMKYRISCENRLIHQLKQKDPTITLMLSSRSANGFDLTPNRLMIGKVNDFQLTDINVLTRPSWHSKDWIHTGSKPLGVD